MTITGPIESYSEITVSEPEPPTPGWLTTEFLTTVINQATGLICILIAVFGPGEEGLKQLLVMAGLSLMGVQGISYGLSRAFIKKASRPTVIYKK